MFSCRCWAGQEVVVGCQQEHPHQSCQKAGGKSVPMLCCTVLSMECLIQSPRKEQIVGLNNLISMPCLVAGNHCYVGTMMKANTWSSPLSTAVLG